MYANVLIASVLASAATAVYTNGTSTAIVTDIATTTATITSCSANKCSESVVTTGVTVVTSTVSGEVTEYTTYCPLTSEAPSANTTVPETSAPVASTTPISSTVSKNGTVSSTATIETGNGANKLAAGAAALAGVAGVLLL